ncbi:hypothetical protein EMIT07CA2_90203 [Brevibacillus sp. IT-7CA2]
MKVLGKAVGGFSMAPTEGMCSLVTLNSTVRALRNLEANVNKRKSSCKDGIDGTEERMYDPSIFK